MSPNEKNLSKQDRIARSEQMRKERDKASKRQRNVISIAIVAVVIVIAGVAAYGIKSASDDNQVADLPYAAPANTTSDETGITYDAEAAGAEAPEGEPVEVEIYEDLQCPACAAFFGVNGQFLDEQVESGEIVVTYRPAAFLDAASTDRYSSRALNAAACVLDAEGVQGFKAYSDLLYANQPAEGGAGLTDEELIDYAAEAGASDISACVNRQEFAEWVEKATEDFRNAEGVTGTPSVFVDGKKVESANQTTLTTEELQSAIDAAKA